MGPPKIDISFALKKNWLLSGYTLSYAGSANLADGMLPHVVSRILTKVVPTLLKGEPNNIIRNFKGRNPTDRLIDSLPIAREHELYSVTGEVASADNDDEILWAPFSYDVFTKLKGFVGQNDVEYNVELSPSDEYPSSIPPQSIADAETVKIKSFRFGLEHFQPTTQQFFFGYTPAVQETVLLDATTAELKFELRVESNSRSVKNPLVEVPELGLVLEAIGNVCGLNLLEDLNSRLLTA